MAFLIGAELADARHRSVVADDFADHSGFGQAGEAGEVDGGLGVTGAAQHTAGHGAQREDVAGPDEGVRTCVRIREQADRPGAVGGGDAGGNAGGGIHADGEGGAQALLVAAGHLRQVEVLGAVESERRADQPAAVDGHEIHHVGRAQAGRADQVRLVFPVGIIRADDQAAGRDFGDDFIDGAETERRVGHGVADGLPLGCTIAGEESTPVS